MHENHVLLGAVALVVVVAAASLAVDADRPRLKHSENGPPVRTSIPTDLPPVDKLPAQISLEKATQTLQFDDGSCESGLGAGITVTAWVDFDVPTQCVMGGLRVVSAIAKMNTGTAFAALLGQAGAAPPAVGAGTPVGLSSPIPGNGPCPSNNQALVTRGITGATVTGTANFFFGFQNTGFIGRDTTGAPAGREWLGCGGCAGMTQYSPGFLDANGLGGNWMLRVTVEDTDCLPAELEGACCLDFDECVVTTHGDCVAQGGRFTSEGVPCRDETCATVFGGACCLDFDDCVVTTYGDCVAQGGRFTGEGMRCRDETCVHDFEAPLVVQAQPNGSFETDAYFTPSEDVLVAGFNSYGFPPDDNVLSLLFVDCFCDPGCLLEAGTTLQAPIEGHLIDLTREGRVRVSIDLCDPPGGFSATVRVMPPGLCADDADCNDGLFCNGVESCDLDMGDCQAVIACAPFVDGCVVRDGSCSEVTNECIDVPVDERCPPGQVCRPSGECLDPLFVSLVSFTATVVADGVRLNWSTASEVDHRGFRVLRLRERSAAFASSRVGRPSLSILTPQLIYARGSALSGADYEYLDAGAPERGPLLYYLQDVDLFGRATLHGPVSVRPQRRAP